MNETDFKFGSVIEELLLSKSQCRKLLEITKQPYNENSTELHLFQGWTNPGATAIRTGEGTYDATITTKSHFNLPAVTYTIQTEFYSNDYDKSFVNIVDKISELENYILFPVVDVALDYSKRILNCPHFLNPYQLLAAEACHMMKKEGISYGSIVNMSDNVFVLFANPDEAGIMAIYHEWTPIEITENSITLSAIIGCAVNPKGVIAVKKSAPIEKGVII